MAIAFNAHEKLLDGLWVEMGARVALQFFDGGIVGQGLAVRAIGGHGVVGVGHREDARLSRDFFAGQSIGIPLAVPAFVVVVDGGNQRVQELDGLQNLLAKHRVQFDIFELFIGEGPGLVEVGVTSQNAAVVHDARLPDELDLGGGHVHLFGGEVGVQGDAIGVASGIRIHGLERPCKTLDGLAKRLLQAAVQLGVVDGRRRPGAEDVHQLALPDGEVKARGARVGCHDADELLPGDQGNGEKGS